MINILHMMLSFQSDLSPKFSYFLPSGDTSRIIYHTDSIGISNTITRYVVRHTVPDYGQSNFQLILWSLNQLKGSHSFLCTYLMYLSDPILYLMVPFHAMVNYQIVLWIYGYKQAFLLACSFHQTEMYNL